MFEWKNEFINEWMNDYWPGTDQPEGRVGRDHLVPASWISPPLHCTGTCRIVLYFALKTTILKLLKISAYCSYQLMSKIIQFFLQEYEKVFFKIKNFIFIFLHDNIIIKSF